MGRDLSFISTKRDENKTVEGVFDRGYTSRNNQASFRDLQYTYRQFYQEQNGSDQFIYRHI
jgi:hypothetical protein